MESLDVHPRILQALKRCKIQDFVTVLSLSGPDLCRRTHLPLSDVNALQKAVATAVNKHPPVTALQILKGDCPAEFKISKLTTGCPIIDAFLRGGILCQGITEIAGESASGKTQLCMQLSLTCQLSSVHGGLDGGAFYLCTEDVFPNRRLVQMVNLLKRRADDPEIKKTAFLDNIFIEHAADVDDLWNCVTKKIPVLLAAGRVRLIIIDSIAALFRCEFGGGGGVVERAKQLSSFAARLRELNSTYTVPVICVNQVSGVMSDSSSSADNGTIRRVTPALGLSWANLVTCRLMLQRTRKHITLRDQHYGGGGEESSEKGTEKSVDYYDANVRSMEVMFAPHLPNSICHYIVDTEGVKGFSGMPGLPVL